MRRLVSVSLCLAALCTLCASPALALNPSRTYRQTPEALGLSFKAVDVKTNDGKATLKVWDIQAKTKTTRLVLIAHNGEGNMADALRRAAPLAADANVVLFDYRGFGQSSEFDIDKNMMIYPHFQDDLDTMIDYCRKQHVAQFSLYGYGIGAGLALGMGYGRPEIKAIIADTPFLSMEDLESRMSGWDSPMEVPFAGYEKRYEPATTVTGAPGKHLTRVGLIVGSGDRLFKAADYEGLRKAAGKLGAPIIAPVFSVKTAKGQDAFAAGGAAYLKQLKGWLPK